MNKLSYSSEFTVLNMIKNMRRYSIPPRAKNNNYIENRKRSIVNVERKVHAVI